MTVLSFNLGKPSVEIKRVFQCRKGIQLFKSKTVKNRSRKRFMKMNNIMKEQTIEGAFTEINKKQITGKKTTNKHTKLKGNRHSHNSNFGSNYLM